MTNDQPRIGQVTNSAAARALADRIDAGLGVESVRFDGPAKDGLASAWRECDLIISHLALGATTRLIAPLLESKKSDPGVVVIDEGGRFAVPLVGGHAGGANDLARRIGEITDAVAVVTTATDSLGVPGLDTLGWAYSGDVAGVTRSLLDGDPVLVQRTQPWPLPALPGNATEDAAAPVARIVVTDLADAPEEPDVPAVVLHPRSLVVGMGANRGTEVGELRELLLATLAEGGLAVESVGTLASVDAKADEEGLIALAAELGVEFVTLPAEELAEQDVPNPSEHALTHVGTPSVSEAAVLASGAELLVDKRKSTNATCAVGRIVPLGKLSVIGLGPGSRDLLTPRARTAIASASVIVGYGPYVEQIKDLVRPGAEIATTGMGGEEARTALAIAKAREGRRVAFVCSGDPAIYAMASPTLEQGTDGVDVEIVPGVTAELAASAVLGAVLGHDHATISLSDLHTDWEVIEKRLQAVADGDLVVALYNPRSRTRLMHLPRALEIIGAQRPPTTPVAVVEEAERPGMTVRMATLADFDVEWVNMNSIVLIGSSTTQFISSGRGKQLIVTPRDYHWMDRS